jgi:hypothetical protein
MLCESSWHLRTVERIGGIHASMALVIVFHEAAENRGKTSRLKFSGHMVCRTRGSYKRRRRVVANFVRLRSHRSGVGCRRAVEFVDYDDFADAFIRSPGGPKRCPARKNRNGVSSRLRTSCLLTHQYSLESCLDDANRAGLHSPGRDLA